MVLAGFTRANFVYEMPAIICLWFVEAYCSAAWNLLKHFTLASSTWLACLICPGSCWSNTYPIIKHLKKNYVGTVKTKNASFNSRRIQKTLEHDSNDVPLLLGCFRVVVVWGHVRHLSVSWKFRGRDCWSGVSRSSHRWLNFRRNFMTWKLIKR